jgi:hypothetical protein
MAWTGLIFLKMLGWRIEEDMQKIKDFYATITGKRQGLFGNAAIRS